MVFRRFRWNVVIRILTLAASLLLLVFLLLTTTFYASALVLACLISFQVYSLVRFVEHTNMELGRFLRSIRYSDFSQTFTGRGRGASFDELQAAFSGIMTEFRKERSAREEHANYLQTVVRHVGTGLLSYTADGEVGLINTAAKRLLRVNHLRNINSLESAHPVLVASLRSLMPGDRILVRVTDSEEPLHVILNATTFKLQEREFTLVALQNIRSELEEKEMEAWQNLTRVLTHEIMNSVTPISSLSATVNTLVQTAIADRGPLKEDIVADIRGALQTIERRSQGLLHFVEAYRNLTRLPRPDIRTVRLRDLFSQVERLMQTKIPGSHVTFRSEVDPPDLEVRADPELIEQVLINLLLNALQALQGQDDGSIGLFARMNARARPVIEVRDNGPGILKEVQEQIFIPFFTTKKEGSGIGLSLSRQIMRLHRGTILVRSDPGRETVFTLQF